MGDVKIQSVKLNVREHLENQEVDGTIFKCRLQRGLDNRERKWFDSGLRQDFFFFTKSSKPALWLNQPPIQRLQGHLPRG